MSMLDTTAARREARAAIAASLSCLDADGAAYLARKITPAMDMMTALSDELDDARQTIGVQQAALDGAATTVERYEAEVTRLRALLDAAQRHIDAHEYGNGPLDRLIEDLERERDEWRSRSEDAEAECDRLRAFADRVMAHWPDGDVEGGAIQAYALECRLLALVDPPPTAPCGEGCQCAEYYDAAEFAAGGVRCHRRTSLLTGGEAAP